VDIAVDEAVLDRLGGGGGAAGEFEEILVAWRDQVRETAPESPVA